MYTKKIYFSGDVAELQDIFNGVNGVLKVTAGFIDAQNVISYANRELRSIENIAGAEIEFNPKKIDISTLLDILFNNLNPYEKNNLGVYYSSGEDAPQVELHMNFVANKGKCPATTSAALIMNDPNSNPRLNRQCYVIFGRFKSFRQEASVKISDS